MDSSSLIDTFLNYGAVGLVLILIVTGLLVTKGHLGDVAKEKEAWKTAYEQEREARLSLENSSSTAIDQGQLAITLLRELRNSGPEGKDAPRGIPQ